MTNKIIEAYNSDNDVRPDLLNNILFNDKILVPSIYIEWMKWSIEEQEPLDRKIILNSESLYPLLDQLDKNSSTKILELLKNFEVDLYAIEINLRVLFEIIQIIEQAGYKVLAAIRPTEWMHQLFVYKNPEDILPYYFFHHFKEARYSAEGWFDEFFEGFDKSINDFLNDNHYSEYLNINDRSQLKYNIIEGPFGQKVTTNLDILNLTEEFFETAKKGLLAAKKFC